jgi:cytochrome c oxidase subunit IV
VGTLLIRWILILIVATIGGGIMAGLLFGVAWLTGATLSTFFVILFGGVCTLVFAFQLYRGTS